MGCNTNKEADDRQKPAVTTGTAPKEHKVDYQSEEFLSRALTAEAKVREQATAIGSACSYFSALLTAAGIVGGGHPISVGKNSEFMALVASGQHQPFHPLFEELLDFILEATKERQEKAEYVKSRIAERPDPGDPDPAAAPIRDALLEAIGYLSDIIRALNVYDGFFLRATSKELVMRDRTETRLDLKAVIDKEVVPAVLRGRQNMEGECSPAAAAERIKWLQFTIDGIDRRLMEIEKSNSEHSVELQKLREDFKKAADWVGGELGRHKSDIEWLKNHSWRVGKMP